MCAHVCVVQIEKVNVRRYASKDNIVRRKKKRKEAVDTLPQSHTEESCEAIVQHIGEGTASTKNSINT